MLLSIEDHTKLLTIPWAQFDKPISTHNLDDVNNTGPLYIKTLFDQDGYKVLVTNLQYVWFERGDATTIAKTASSHRLEISCNEQVNILITSIRLCFLHPEKCTLRLFNSGELLIDYKEIDKGFTSLSWTFHCSPLEMALCGNKSDLDGPTVLYKHFIAPLVAINQSNRLDSKTDEEEAADETSRTQDTWLSQLSCAVVSQKQDDDSIEYKEERSTEPPVPSSPPKKLTDPDKELERRTRLESELLKKKELKKKKRRLF